MASDPVRYRSVDEDSGRWIGFPFRDGDIVISTRSKSGTTWMQMICALLAFRTPELPETMAELSPWLDWLVEPRDEVYARLAAQTHRRFIKTHTPLDGLPIDPGATYVVVVRHPLDVAVSMYHHGDNIDRARWREMTGQPPDVRPAKARAPLHDWLLDWIEDDVTPQEQLDSLPGLMWHASDAWRRRDEPNIALVHYADLSADLDGGMRALAAALGIDVPASLWPSLVEAAGFEAMRDRAARVSPAPPGVLKDPVAFFRQGRSGAGAEVLTPDELARYRSRAAQLAPADMLTWLHRGTGRAAAAAAPPAG